MLDPDAESAKSLTLAAIIIQAAFSAVGVLMVLMFTTFYLTYAPSLPAGQTGTTMPVFLPGIFVAAFGFSFSIGLLWILLDYFLIYKKLAEGRVAEAETPGIVLGIAQLVLGGLISGIMLIVAYVKIRDSRTRYPQRYGYTQPPTPPAY